MRETRQECVTARRIDQDEIASLLQAREAGEESLGFLCFGLVEVAFGTGIDANDFRHRQLGAGGCHPAQAILEITGQGALAYVEVDDADFLAHAHERHGQVHGNGGLAGPAFFVADDNHPGIALLH